MNHPPICGHRHGPWVCVARRHLAGRHYYAKAGAR